MQAPSRSPRERSQFVCGRFSEGVSSKTAVQSSHSTRAALSNNARENAEPFREFDAWAEAVLNRHFFHNPVVQSASLFFWGVVEGFRRACCYFFASHSTLVHSLSLFCFLSAVVSRFIAYSIDSEIAAFTIPAFHHGWDLREKSRGCRNAALYYFFLGVVVLLLSWIRSFPFVARISGMFRSVPTPREQRRQRHIRRQARDYTGLLTNDGSDSELQPISSGHGSAMRDRSGYSSSGEISTARENSSSLSRNSQSQQSYFDIGVSGRVPKSTLKLVGLGADSSTDEN